MMMEEFEYCNLFRQLNEEQRLIFDDVMHRKQLDHDILICLFFIGDARVSKTYNSSIIIIYNKFFFFILTKTKTLLMASISKVVFNINGLTIHSTLNIPIQQSLSSLPNLSTKSLNRFTYQYEPLQLVVIDEISLVGAKMLNVIDNRLKSIKHIQNKKFSGVDALKGKYLFLIHLHN
jgi:hypothetical protein